MKTADPLYHLFEQHLHNALVENESAGDLIERVVKDYLSELASQGSISPTHAADIESDLREEVLEMFRKKTYGHYNLAEYRNQMNITGSSAASHTSAEETKTPARGRRSS
jgi:hypothetical protein